jgi:hypothetical protein
LAARSSNRDRWVFASWMLTVSIASLGLNPLV